MQIERPSLGDGSGYKVLQQYVHIFINLYYTYFRMSGWIRFARPGLKTLHFYCLKSHIPGA